PIISAIFFPFSSFVELCHLSSFPTRRSSDLRGFLRGRDGLHDPGDVHPSLQGDGSVSGCNEARVRSARPIYFVRLVWICSRNARSEEHTSELQSHLNLVCRLLLEKKKKYYFNLASIGQLYSNSVFLGNRREKVDSCDTRCCSKLPIQACNFIHEYPLGRMYITAVY